VSRLLALGDLTLDIVVTPAGPIATGSDTPGAIQFRIGGSAANTARAFAGLGGRAEFIGSVGDDRVGDRLRAGLREAGVVDRLKTVAGQQTARLIVLLSADGQRTFITSRGAADHLAAADISREWFEGADVLHLPAYSLLNRPLCKAAGAAAGYAHEAGALVSVDLASSEPLRAFGAEAAWQAVADVRPDVLFATEDEAAVLARSLTDLAALVVIKLGSRGCRILIGDVQFNVPGQPASVADSTGAGDAFDAGFLFARIAQPKTDPRRWATAGNEAAAQLLRAPRVSLDL
jgi:sugar/nucleoside kinase (ribokinase family)